MCMAITAPPKAPERYICDFCKSELVKCRGCNRAVHQYELTEARTACWRCADLTTEQRAEFARALLDHNAGHDTAPRLEDFS